MNKSSKLSESYKCLTDQKVQEHKPTHTELVNEFGQNFKQDNEQNSLKKCKYEWKNEFRLAFECPINKQQGSDEQKPSEKYKTYIYSEDRCGREDEILKINIFSSQIE